MVFWILIALILALAPLFAYLSRNNDGYDEIGPVGAVVLTIIAGAGVTFIWIMASMSFGDFHLYKQDVYELSDKGSYLMESVPATEGLYKYKKGETPDGAYLVEREYTKDLGWAVPWEHHSTTTTFEVVWKD